MSIKHKNILLTVKKNLRNNSLFGSGFRFISAGLINTLLTLTVYQLLLIKFGHGFSYAVSWIVGICFLVIVYPSKVFLSKSNSWMQKIATVVGYVFVFFIGLFVLDRLVLVGVSERLAIFFVLITTSIINFVYMRYVFRK